MKWNWEESDWPKFTYQLNEIVDFEKQFLQKSGSLFGSLKHINNEDKDTLRVDLLSSEAFKTSEVEGELLSRDSLQSSIRRQFGLQTDTKRVPPAEQGISEIMVDLYRTYDQPLTHEQLFRWHEMLTYGRRDLIDMGRYRTHEDPMQIVSGILSKPKVHYEAPPSRRVPKEMDAFVRWFNESKTQIDPLVRAGVAHLYFESIHPFEDGNGRIGRAITEKALSQGLNRPTLIVLSFTIEKDKKAYYAALQENSIGLEITKWLVYFSEVILKAQDYTQEVIDFTIAKGKFFLRYQSLLNERQEKVIERMFREGPKGFDGGLSADNYITIAGTTASTATRDLQKLVELGAVSRTGERKGTRYWVRLEGLV